MIKIAIETPNFDKGGLEKVVLDTALSFKNRGFSPFIYTLGEIGLLATEARNNQISVYQVKNSFSLFLLLFYKRPDIAISHFTYKGYAIFKKLHIPNITFIHNIYDFFSQEQKDEFVSADKYVSKYISVSSTASRYVTSNLGIDSGKIVTIPNGLDIVSERRKDEELNSLQWKDFGVEEDDHVFLNVAAYNLHKGHYLMANALKKVIDINPKVKLICLGAPVYQPHFEELKKYIYKLKLENNMLLLGHFSDITWFYKNSDVFLLPSFIEGWSIAMNEAMYYQLPLILTAVGGAPEVIDDSDIGILLPNEYGDVTELNMEKLNSLAYSPQNYRLEVDLSEAMLSMVIDSQIWKEKGKYARIKIQQKYDINIIVDRYIEVIIGLCN